MRLGGSPPAGDEPVSPFVDGAITFDSVLSRWQPIRERMRLQFRAEMYNILNHPNAGAPSASITSSTFGQITSKSGSRTITLALRLEF